MGHLLTGDANKKELLEVIEAMRQSVDKDKKTAMSYKDWRILTKTIGALQDDIRYHLILDYGVLTICGHCASWAVKINDTFTDELRTYIDFREAKANAIDTLKPHPIEAMVLNNTTTCDYTTTNTGLYTTTNTLSYTQTLDGLYEQFKNLEEKMKVKDEYVNNKENTKMDIMKNFDFGRIDNDGSVRLSPYGLAVKNSAGTWVSYDANTGDVVDVDVFNFDGCNFLYKMPVAVKNIAVGDIIVHNRRAMFVTGFMEDTGNPIVIDIAASERKEILPIKSPFGFNFYTRVMNLADGMFKTGKPDADNPFGNILPYLLMGNKDKVDDMLPMLFMLNGNAMDNPMLMYAMMKGDSKDMLPFLMMMNQNNNSKCGCGGCH